MSSKKTLPSIASLSGPTTLPPIVENKQTSLYLPSIFTDLDSLTSKGKQSLAPTYPAPFMHNVYRRDSSASASDSDGEPSAVFSRNSFSDNSTSPHYHKMDSKTTDSASTISPSNPIHIHTVNSTLLLSQITPSNRRGVPRSGLRHSCKYPDCGWSFKRFEHLKRHMMTHSGEKPFVCDFPGCGKSFGRSDNFAAHTRIHTHQPLPVDNVNVNPSAQEKKRPNSAEASLAVNMEKKQRLSKSPSPAVAVHRTSNSCSIKSLLNEDISSNINVAKDPTDDERNAAAMCLAFLPFAAQREPVGHTLPTNNNIPLSPTSSTTLASPSSPVGSPSDYTGPFTFLERSAPVQQRRSLPMDFYPSRNQTATSTLHMENYITFQQPARPSLPTVGHSQRLTAEASDAFDPSKPHVCTHPSGCNRRFKRREHLRRHSRTHTDEKPFVCPTCMKSFSRSDNLNQHARTHGVRTGSMTSNNINNTTTVTTSTNPTPTTFPSTLLRRSVSMSYFPSEVAAQPGETKCEGNRTS